MSRSFKKTFSFVSLLFLGISMPLAARAGIAESIANVLLSLIFGLIMSISNFILLIATWILQWVLSENFIDWGYTHNPVVDMGWGLTRDLGNMFFVIYLAFVGLATALRIEKYKTQKILPTLVLVALLVNFSPVICGVIVDASNILMSFFLSESGGGGWQAFVTQVTNLKNAVLAGGLGQALNPITILGVIVQALLLTLFNIIAALLYVLFAFIFAARYVAIWLLVILSPLAFFSLAVPDLKSFWSKWWNMFLQWCFVGVTAGFFLYLGHHMMVEADSMMGTVSPGEGVIGTLTGPIIELLHFIIPYGIALGFLGMGLFAALGSSAKGANIAVKAAKWTGGKAGDFAKTQTWDRLRTSEQGEDIAKGLAEAPARRKLLTKEGREEWKEAWGEASVGKKVGILARSIAPFSGYAARPALESVSAGRKEIQTLREKLKKQFDKQPELLESYVKGTPGHNWQERIAGTLALGDVGGPKSLDNLEEGKPGELENILKMTRTYRLRKMMKDLITFKPDLIMQTEEGEDLLDKLKQDFGDITLPAGIGSVEDLSDEQKEEIMSRVKSKLSETGNKPGRMIVEELIWRGLDDENVTELMNAGYSAGEAVIAAVFKQVVEGIKPGDVSDLSDDTLKNPMFQEMAARYQSKNFAREILDKGGGIRDQFIDTLNNLGAEELIKTNDDLMRWILYSWEGQARVGSIRGAETPEKYEILKKLVDHPGVKGYYDQLQMMQEKRADVKQLQKEVRIRENLKKQAEAKGDTNEAAQLENIIQTQENAIAVKESEIKTLGQHAAGIRKNFSDEQKAVWEETQKLLKRKAERPSLSRKRGKDKDEGDIGPDIPDIIVPPSRGPIRPTPPGGKLPTTRGGGAPTAPLASTPSSTRPASPPPPALKPIKQSEAKRIMNAMEIHGQPFKGQQLTPAILEQEGLAPRHKIEMDDANVYLPESAYDVGAGRMAITGYVEKDNKITARTWYRSNSQGVWRYLPDYMVDNQGEIRHFGKGHWMAGEEQEESITLPTEVQKALSDITGPNNPPIKVKNPELLFAGTAREFSAKGTFYLETKGKPEKLKGNFYKKGKTTPEQMKFQDKNQGPNFSKQLSSWTQETELYGPVEVEVYPSKDNQLKYMFCRDKHGRAWIGGVQKEGKITSTGAGEIWIQAGDLTVPAYEYYDAKNKARDQTGGYGNPDMQKGEYADMFDNYLSKIPVIQEYLKHKKQ